MCTFHQSLHVKKEKKPINQQLMINVLPFTPVERTSSNNMSFFLFCLSLPFLQQHTCSVKSLGRSPFWSQSVRQVGPTGRTRLPTDSWDGRWADQSCLSYPLWESIWMPSGASTPLYMLLRSSRETTEIVILAWQHSSGENTWNNSVQKRCGLNHKGHFDLRVFCEDKWMCVRWVIYRWDTVALSVERSPHSPR